MNKHIKLLASETFFDDETNEPSSIKYTFTETKMKKFAELLIESVLEQVKIGFDPMDIKQFYKE